MIITIFFLYLLSLIANDILLHIMLFLTNYTQQYVKEFQACQDGKEYSYCNRLLIPPFPKLSV